MAQSGLSEEKRRKQIRAYEFFKQHVESGQLFTLEELASATGWSMATVRTYRAKQWRDFLERSEDKYRVRLTFRRIKQQRFLDVVTQNRNIYSRYQRLKYGELVTYEFLLPLTREDRLRSGLDDLFYGDTIERSLREIGLDKISRIILRSEDETDEQYIAKVSEFVSKRFGGYSIFHANGRFRAGELVTRQEAGQMLADDEPYLIDETTAVVRFVIPCMSSKLEYGENFESVLNAIDESGESHLSRDEIDREILQIRLVFFYLFVEAVVRIIQGEDQIWLLETGPTRRLYVWEARSPRS